MTPHNKDRLRTAYTISVDARDGVTHRHLGRRPGPHRAGCWPTPRPSRGRSPGPGHVFPLRYREGGVLVRRGHTEAAVDLARLAGLTPAGVLVEVVNDDGTMKRGRRAAGVRRRARAGDDLDRGPGALPPPPRAARRAGRRDPAADRLRRVHGVRLPGRHRRQRAHRAGPRRHLRPRAGADPGALRVPDRRRVRQPPLRLRPAAGRGARRGSSRRAAASSSTCAATRAGGSAWSPSCRPTPSRTTAATPSTPTSTSGCPPTPATTAPPPRSCATSGVGSVRLLTNNPAKTTSLEDFGVPVAERVPLTPHPNDHNLAYLRTKRDRMGHDLPDLGTPPDERSTRHERRRSPRPAAGRLPRPAGRGRRRQLAPGGDGRAGRRCPAGAARTTASRRRSSSGCPGTFELPGRRRGARRAGVRRRGGARRRDPRRHAALRLRLLGGHRRAHPGRARPRRRPVGFGVLTCDDEQQALDRAGLDGSHEDKGYEATVGRPGHRPTLRKIRRGYRD